MSGGGGSSGPGGGFGRDTGQDCARLRFDAFLASVQADALQSLAIDEVLEVEVQQAPVRAIVARRDDGSVAGALTTRVRELLRCLQQQVRFQATVLTIAGGDVCVRVEPV